VARSSATARATSWGSGRRPADSYGLPPLHAPPEELAAFRASAVDAGADAALHTNPGAGHFYSDPSLPDYDATATDRTWRHVHALLDKVRHMPL
jgi:dienelactone hydrolase